MASLKQLSYNFFLSILLSSLRVYIQGNNITLNLVSYRQIPSGKNSTKFKIRRGFVTSCEVTRMGGVSSIWMTPSGKMFWGLWVGCFYLISIGKESDFFLSLS